MAETKGKYRLVGKAVQGTNTVGYKISELSTGREMLVRKDVMAYLVGMGAVQDCIGQLYNDSVLYRGQNGMEFKNLAVDKVGNTKQAPSQISDSPVNVTGIPAEEQGIDYSSPEGLEMTQEAIEDIFRRVGLAYKFLFDRKEYSVINYGDYVCLGFTYRGVICSAKIHRDDTTKYIFEFDNNDTNEVISKSFSLEDSKGRNDEIRHLAGYLVDMIKMKILSLQNSQDHQKHYALIKRKVQPDDMIVVLHVMANSILQKKRFEERDMGSNSRTSMYIRSELQAEDMNLQVKVVELNSTAIEDRQPRVTVTYNKQSQEFRNAGSAIDYLKTLL